ncbi:hypothetical protein PROFUN_00694 [Planoprotostelium fungivorum]|uniref:Homeobox domain-containing protein n=1 Tax=Planoprotostelium fungivorum TaxID=1890364 RepID=A0A2P6NU37_9EUKA|nr:hypothetical protein PROFUN_00694 [Planoprotostelium fungivorum]
MIERFRSLPLRGIWCALIELVVVLLSLNKMTPEISSGQSFEISIRKSAAFLSVFGRSEPLFETTTNSKGDCCTTVYNLLRVTRPTKAEVMYVADIDPGMSEADRASPNSTPEHNPGSSELSSPGREEPSPTIAISGVNHTETEAVSKDASVVNSPPNNDAPQRISSVQQDMASFLASQSLEMPGLSRKRKSEDLKDLPFKQAKVKDFVEPQPKLVPVQPVQTPVQPSFNLHTIPGLPSANGFEVVEQNGRFVVKMKGSTDAPSPFQIVVKSPKTPSPASNPTSSTTDSQPPSYPYNYPGHTPRRIDHVISPMQPTTPQVINANVPAPYPMNGTSGYPQRPNYNQPNVMDNGMMYVISDMQPPPYMQGMTIAQPSIYNEAPNFTPQYNEFQPPPVRQDTRMQRAVTILKTWFREHISSPFPSDEERMHLANLSGLEVAQVDYWFNVARMRLRQLQQQQPQQQQQMEPTNYNSGFNSNKPRYVESVVHHH